MMELGISSRYSMDLATGTVPIKSAWQRPSTSTLYSYGATHPYSKLR
jgi:hypothetical protein